jgi:maleate isomerase
MYGARGRIGLLVPSVNTVVEPEFGRIVPEGVGVYAARMRNGRGTLDVEDLTSMCRHAERAADELGSARCAVLAFACTSGSFLEGESWEADLRARLEQVGQCPVVTTSGAVAAALARAGVRRVAVATPYPEDLDLRERAFLEQKGFEVPVIRGMRIRDSFDIGQVTPREVLDFARATWQAADGQADGMFLSCTNLPTIEVLAQLEQEIQAPVISSNAATAWAALSALHVADVRTGFGSLLDGLGG